MDTRSPESKSHTWCVQPSIHTGLHPYATFTHIQMLGSSVDKYGDLVTIDCSYQGESSISATLHLAEQGYIKLNDLAI